MTHGVYARQLDGPAELGEMIVDLNARIRGLGAYLDKRGRRNGVDGWFRGLDLLSKLAGRSARLMRTLRWLSGDEGDQLYAALEDALDAIADEREIEL